MDQGAFRAQRRAGADLRRTKRLSRGEKRASRRVDGVQITTILSDAVDAKNQTSTYAESDGHCRPEELDQKTLRRQAAPHAHAVEVGLDYWYS